MTDSRWLFPDLEMVSGLQIDRCFGFETAVEEAQRALLAAKVSACTFAVLQYLSQVAAVVMLRAASILAKHSRWPTSSSDTFSGASAILQVEASSAFRGVGLVKLMGRSSGFIAMQASMASGKLQHHVLLTRAPSTVHAQTFVGLPANSCLVSEEQGPPVRVADGHLVIPEELKINVT